MLTTDIDHPYMCSVQKLGSISQMKASDRSKSLRGNYRNYRVFMVMRKKKVRKMVVIFQNESPIFTLPPPPPPPPPPKKKTFVARTTRTLNALKV